MIRSISPDLHRKLRSSSVKPWVWRWASARSSPSRPSRCCGVRGMASSWADRLRRAVLVDGRLFNTLETGRALAEINGQLARYAIQLEAAGGMAADFTCHPEGVDAERIQARHVGAADAGLHRARVDHHRWMVALHLPWQVQQAHAVQVLGRETGAGPRIQRRGAVDRQAAELFSRRGWRWRRQRVSGAEGWIGRLGAGAAAQGQAQLAGLVGAHGREQQRRHALAQRGAQLHQFRIVEIAVRRTQLNGADLAAQALPLAGKGGRYPA